jgi:hypothetical protein
MTSRPPRSGSGVTDHIELSIPARAELIQMVRMAAAVVGSRADLALNDVEDLRLGVEELCLLLVGPTGNAPGRLELRYVWDDEAIEVTCTVTAGDDHHGPLRVGPAAPDGDVGGELSTQILDALVDEHGVFDTAERTGAWLRMQRVR